MNFSRADARQNKFKKSEKTSEKQLTKKINCDILDELSAREQIYEKKRERKVLLRLKMKFKKLQKILKNSLKTVDKQNQL